MSVHSSSSDMRRTCSWILVQVQKYAAFRRSYTNSREVAAAVSAGRQLLFKIILLISAGWHAFIALACLYSTIAAPGRSPCNAVLYDFLCCMKFQILRNIGVFHLSGMFHLGELGHLERTSYVAFLLLMASSFSFGINSITSSPILPPLLVPSSQVYRKWKMSLTISLYWCCFAILGYKHISISSVKALSFQRLSHTRGDRCSDR